MQIDHIAIYANNIKKMCFFYKNIIGFEETERVFHDTGKIRMIRLKVSEKQSIELFNFEKRQEKNIDMLILELCI